MSAVSCEMVAALVADARGASMCKHLRKRNKLNEKKVTILLNGAKEIRVPGAQQVASRIATWSIAGS